MRDLRNRHAPRSTTALMLITCLYRECEKISRNLDSLACLLEKQDGDGALRALLRVCVSLLVADELLGLGPCKRGGEFETASALRNRLRAEVVPELEAVRHELQDAAKIVRSILSTESRLGPTAIKALDQVDRVLADASEPPRPNQRW